MTNESPAALASQFLQCVRHDDIAQANALLDAHPELARFSIHTAAALGDADGVASFLAADPASATRVDGVEPLIYAVAMDLKTSRQVSDAAHLETVRRLLDAGASPNAFVQLKPDDENSRIPALYFACVANNVAVARLLLERGAEPNDGESVYHAAEHNHRECLALLLEQGANISGAHAHWGNTPLYFLAGYRASNPRSATVVQGMYWLLEHGADPNVPSYAASGTKGTRGVAENPLHRLCANGYGVDVVRTFLEHGAAVDTPRGDGRTAYTLAYAAGNSDVAALLEEAGADTTKLRPIDHLLGACARADRSAAQALLATNPSLVSELSLDERRALHQAVSENREDRVQLMLSLGWPVSDESEWEGTPLHWAAWHGRPSLVRALLDAGAPVNVRDRQYGSSPIAWTAHGSTFGRPGHDAEYVKIAEMLLDAGATRAEAINQWGESPEGMASAAVAAILSARW